LVPRVPGLGQITWRIVQTKKIEGPLGKKIARKLRNSRRARGGDVGAEGMVTKGTILRVLKPNTNAQRMLFLSHLLRSPLHPFAPLCTKLLNISAQFLIGSPGTLVQVLPTGDCAGSSNNLVPRGAKLSAIDETAKAFFERLYFVLGLSPFEPRVNCPYAPTPPPLTQQFLDFRAIFLPSGPSFFWQYTIQRAIWPCPGTLISSINSWFLI